MDIPVNPWAAENRALKVRALVDAITEYNTGRGAARPLTATDAATLGAADWKRVADAFHVHPPSPTTRRHVILELRRRERG